MSARAYFGIRVQDDGSGMKKRRKSLTPRGWILLCELGYMAYPRPALFLHFRNGREIELLIVKFLCFRVIVWVYSRILEKGMRRG